MNVSIKLKGTGGHTEISFKKNELSLEWLKTDDNEQKGLVEFVRNAINKGYEVKRKDEQVVSVVADDFRKKGSLTLVAKDENAASVIIKDLLNFEVKSGKLVMEYDPADSTWSVIKASEFKPGEKEEQTLTTSKAASGG